MDIYRKIRKYRLTEIQAYCHDHEYHEQEVTDVFCSPLHAETYSEPCPQHITAGKDESYFEINQVVVDKDCQGDDGVEEYDK